MTQHFEVFVEKDADDYFVASVSDLKGCHTQGKTLEELKERIQEAIELCLEVESIVEPFEIHLREVRNVESSELERIIAKSENL
ncbi:MAG: type II toxin-antitoxin system HicB family antitoxin [Cyanobacteria bacterium P01_E01_bin.42]